MSSILWLDLETFSKVPIKNGTHAYAEGAEIMLIAWAIDITPVQVWDVTANAKIPLELRLALKNPDVLIYAHNSHFDRTVLNHAMPGIAAGGVQLWRDRWSGRWRTTCRVRWVTYATFSVFRSMKPGIKPVSN